MADEPQSMDIVQRPEPALSATSDMPQIAPAAAPEETPAAEVVDEQPKVEDKSATAPEEDAGEPTDGDKKSGDATPPGVKAALSRARNERKAAEQRASQLETQLSQAIEALKNVTGDKVDAKDDPRPNRETFDDPDAYDKALIDWSGRRATEVATKEAEAKAVRDGQVRQIEQTLQTYNDRKAAFEQDHPDFEDVVYQDDLTISPAMSQAILNADDGPAIAYHLGNHPEEAERIAKLAPVQAVYEIGKISLRLQAPPVKPKPDPIRPLGARSGDGAVDPSNESMESYGARRLAELRRVH